MPTTSVEFSQRTYSDGDYQSRLRRPAWLEGFGFSPVLFTPKAQTTVYQPPPPSSQYVPATHQEPPADAAPEPAPPVEIPIEPLPLPSDVHKATSPWVWVAGGTGALVVFWLIARRKKKG
jgi:hypothetical protein